MVDRDTLQSAQHFLVQRPIGSGDSEKRYFLDLDHTHSHPVSLSFLLRVAGEARDSDPSRNHLQYYGSKTLHELILRLDGCCNATLLSN